jgi:hypothetical protein
MIEPVRGLSLSPGLSALRDALEGRNLASFEMHLEAEIE